MEAVIGPDSTSGRLLSSYGEFDNTERSVVGVNANDIVRDLILFDTVILESTRLTELPQLMVSFGVEGLSALLRSGRLKILCQATTIGQGGQTSLLESRIKRGLLPLGSYSFIAIRSAKHDEYIHNCLQAVHKIDYSLKILIRLKRDVVNALLPISNDSGEGAVKQLELDIRGCSPILASAITMGLRSQFDIPSLPRPLEIHTEEIAPSDFRVTTNLGSFGFGDQRAHSIVERGLLGLGGLNHRIEKMRTHSTVCGFQEQESVLFDDRLGFLLKHVTPKPIQQAFARAIRLSDGPEFLPSVDRIDVHRLLEILAAPECQDFRLWLKTVGQSTDTEIKERVMGLRNRLGSLFGGTLGRVSRFIASTGIGYCGAVPSIVAGALDSFLIDRVVPRSGIYVFTKSLYPSIFAPADRGSDQ